MWAVRAVCHREVMLRFSYTWHTQQMAMRSQQLCSQYSRPAEALMYI